MNMSLVLLLVALAAVVAQEGCPDPAMECPDNCTGEQCARFLNAECRENPCHGLCAPNFFWRGRNVTSSCPVQRCSDRVCLGRRQCVEEVSPASCPEGLTQSLCRQYIQTRCVLTPPPTDCSQLSCGPGMYCRRRRNRPEEVVCARARNCDQLVCDEGSLCTETERGPMCVTTIARSCEDLNCPEGTLCVSESIPSRNLSASQCLDQEEAERLPTFDTFFCSSGATICDDPTEACLDIFDSGNYLIPACFDTGCDLESSSACEKGNNRMCASVPDRLNADFATTCIGPTSIESTTNCTLAPEDRCPIGWVCREAFFEGQIFITTCGVPAPTFTAPSCAELECPAPLECNEIGNVQGRGGVARCAGPTFTGDTEDSIQSLLDKIDS